MGVERTKMISIIENMVKHNSLRKSLKEHGISPQSFHSTLNADPILSDLYTSAQQAIAETLAEEIIEISDTETDYGKARNQIDARKWYASKVKPNKFGDRIDLNVNQTVDIRGALTEAINRVRPVSDLDSSVSVQVIETKHKLLIDSTDEKSVEGAENKGCDVNSLEELLK